MRRLLAGTFLLLASCDEQVGTFGPPTPPRPVVGAPRVRTDGGLTQTTNAPPPTPAALTPKLAAPTPKPAAPTPTATASTPTTRDQVRKIYQQRKKDPFCGTGDPWVDLTARPHPPSLEKLLADWALDTRAPDRTIALEGLGESDAPSLLPVWRQLANETGTPFAETIIWGLLRTGGDAEVPTALKLLSATGEPNLAFVARQVPGTISAEALRRRLRLMYRLLPAPSFSLDAKSFLPPRETWAELVRFEPAFTACQTKRPTDSNPNPILRAELVVDDSGKLISASATELTREGEVRNPCAEEVAKNLRFRPATFRDPSDPSPSPSMIIVTIGVRGLE